jgi:drug/metabolite transporter (DMT)-like permease
MTGELLAFAAMLMFASNILVTKFAVGRLDVRLGFVISVVVNLLFATLVFGIELAMRAEPVRFDAMGVLLFALAGACATYLGRFFFFGAIQRLGPARASLFHVSSPAFTAAIAWTFLGETLRLPAVAAIAMTIVGLLLITLPRGLFAEDRRRTPGAERLRGLLASGFAVGAGATLAYSVGNVLRGLAVREWNEPVAGALLGAVAALLLQFVIRRDNATLLRRVRDADAMGLRLYAVGGVLTISAQMCMIASMRYIPVAITTVITLCTPLVVMPFSYLVLKNQERIGARTLLGAGLALAGMAIVVLR